MSNILRACALAASFLAVAACGASSDGGQAASGSQAAGGASGAEPGKGLARASDMVLGDDSAPVTVIEYASVTCGGCAQAHETIIPDLKSEYVDTGKVRFVFREYPKAPPSFVNQSYLASIMARCAADKGGKEAYFLIIDALLKTQRVWITGDTEAELKKIFQQAGLSNDYYDACLKRQDLLDIITANVEEAENTYEIPGTPTFLVDGEIVRVGKFAELKAAIDEALGEESASAEADG